MLQHINKKTSYLTIVTIYIYIYIKIHNINIYNKYNIISINLFYVIYGIYFKIKS